MSFLLLDIDECASANNCDETLSTCVNQNGTYHCDCFSGLVNDVTDRFKCVGESITASKVVGT